jgi:hypothetical protein
LGELPTGQPAFELARAHQGPFEGVPSDRATYQIAAHVPGRFDATLWIFFGSAHPTRDQIDRTQAELDREGFVKSMFLPNGGVCIEDGFASR